jgi:hypothetical protein
MDTYPAPDEPLIVNTKAHVGNKMRYWMFGLLLSCTAVCAGDREAKIKTLMEAQGLLATFEQQLEMGRKLNQEQAQRMMKQLMSQLNPSPEFQERFKNSFDKFIKAVETPWGADVIVEVWGNYFGEKFTDEELDQLIAFYTSELGQKEVLASRESLVQFSHHFAEAGKPIADKAVQAYIKDLQLVAKECNCRRSSE